MLTTIGKKIFIIIGLKFLFLLNPCIYYFQQQRKVEAERIEQRRQTQRQPAPPQGYQIDYNQAHELTKAEDRRAYQDHQV